jgi:hypothetical protein
MASHLFDDGNPAFDRTVPQPVRLTSGLAWETDRLEAAVSAMAENTYNMCVCVYIYIYMYTHIHCITCTSSICISSTFEWYPMDPRVNLWPDLLGWILPVTGGTGAARRARWLLETYGVNVYFGHRIKVILRCLRCLHSIQHDTDKHDKT